MEQGDDISNDIPSTVVNYPIRNQQHQQILLLQFLPQLSPNHSHASSSVSQTPKRPHRHSKIEFPIIQDMDNRIVKKSPINRISGMETLLQISTEIPLTEIGIEIHPSTQIVFYLTCSFIINVRCVQLKQIKIGAIRNYL